MKKYLLAVFCLVFFFQNHGYADTKPAPPPPSPYCEGHARKIISVLPISPSSLLVSAIQTELDRYDSPEYNFNNRYELCFEIQNNTGGNVVSLNTGEVFTLTNTSTREVVIGFLNATRFDDSTTPILSVHGSKVTIFQPTFTNVKKAVVFNGNRYKLVGGTINGVPNQADSLCVEGMGNNIQIKDTAINDCTNAISLNGNNSRISGTSISFSYTATMPPAENYNLEVQEERDLFIENFRRWEDENLIAAGTCLAVSGQNAVLQNISTNSCNGISARLTGNGHRILNAQITGDSIPDKIDLPHKATDCLLLQEASNITLEGNTFAQCQKGIHIVDSQSIYIGPNQIADFGAKKNDIHHNDYAIHAERSQTVYATHNSVHENGFRPYTPEEAYRFGFWPVESNLIFNGESQILPSPKFDPATADGENEQEYPVVKYDAQNNAFIDVKVHVATGRIELSLSRVDFGAEEERYQSSTPFADCSFKDASPSPQSPPIEGGENDGEGVEYLVRCPIQVTDDIKGKRLLAILHGNPVGSSQYAKAMGIINDPTGIPVSGPAPTTGNMTGAGTIVTHAGEGSVDSGAGGPVVATDAGGSKRGMFCSSLQPGGKGKDPAGWILYLSFSTLLAGMGVARGFGIGSKGQ